MAKNTQYKTTSNDSKMQHAMQHKYSLAMLFTLYLAQGLPSGFMTQALPTLLRHYGVSLTQIGLSGMLMLPWALKFLWAPYVDRYGSKRFGHYRSWILVTQSLTISCLILLAFLPIEHLGDLSTLWGMFIVLFVINSLCATQDIATDGLAVNMLKQGGVHWGNTFQVMGSRLGFILGGGAVLYAIDALSWQSTFLLLAGGVFLNSILIFYYKEPQFLRQDSAPNQAASVNHIRWGERLKKSYGYLWSNQELRLWLWVVLSYKIVDGIAGPVLKPMFINLGLGLKEIGLYVTIFGAGCAIAGAVFAGILIAKFSLKWMLLIFSLGHSLVFIYYIFIAHLLETGQFIAAKHAYFSNALEEFFSAMSLVAMLSLIMKYSRQHFAATDFTFQVALMSIVGGGLYTVGGIFADYMGYSLVLYFVFLASLVALLIKLRWAYMNKIY